MEIFRVGAEVMINKMIIDGIVKSITIGQNDSAQYLVGWFSGEAYMTGTFNAEEVSLKTDKDIRKIGFK